MLEQCIIVASACDQPNPSSAKFTSVTFPPLNDEFSVLEVFQLFPSSLIIGALE